MTTSPASDDSWRASALAALQSYSIRGVRFERIAQGLINLSVKITTDNGEQFVLQRLNPIFGDSVNQNLEQVTGHLKQCGLLTPVIIHTSTNALSVDLDGFLWRVLSFVEGHALEALTSPAEAHAAGVTLARFHLALLNFDGELIGPDRLVHDLPRHLSHLDDAMKCASRHPLVNEARTLQSELERVLRHVPQFVAGAPRLVHGDPKVSNMLFSQDRQRGLCMIDLDTLAYMPLAFELGDAMRSWCNPCREDDQTAVFDLGLFKAALSGYFEHARRFVTADEIAAIAPATMQIYLELAARFLADAVEECYFGWDPSRYASRGAHNLARVRGQLAAADSLTRHYARAEQIVADAAQVLPS